MLEFTKFRRGRWVEVRSKAEILATLDERGRLGGMPLMPEMLQYCGRRFRIAHMAHKTCDTITKGKGRWVESSVHLEGLRCDGQAHGGCQASCNIYWKRAWLKPAAGPDGPVQASAAPIHAARCDEAALQRATLRTPAGEAAGEPAYACQATELLDFSKPLSWWDARQYALDLLSGNVGLLRWAKYTALGAFNRTMRLRWHWRQTPRVEGKAVGPTPTEVLDVKPGEWVKVRPAAEIMNTLGANQRNRGLYFDVEMLPFCEKRYQVKQRVDRIIDERSGKMIAIPGSCLILDGATCGGNYSHDRLFCPRAIYPYFREIWVRRDG
jgi:hypothetical protein